MSRLPRVTQNIFASTPGFQQVTQFGSLYNGSPSYTTNTATIQALANWLVGWYNGAINQASPSIEDMNALFLVLTSQLAYLMQTGTPEWDSGTTYFTGNIVAVPVVVFTVTSANATAGATYTNNTQTFTVQSTIAAGTLLTCTYTGQPTSSGTLTKSAGTGDATITFSAEVVSSGLWISVADTNTNNAVTNSSFWEPYYPSLGAPYSIPTVNPSGTGVFYNSLSIGSNTLTTNQTIPSGYNLSSAFLTVSSTLTVAGTACVGTYLKTTGSGVVQVTGSGIVRVY